MRDGIIKEDGTSRLVRGNFPATYDELRALAAAGTLPLDLLFNGTGWAVQPTFLNKGTLLSAATEAALGFTNSQVDYTVDDALSWIWRAVIGDRGAIVVQVTTADGTPAQGIFVAVDTTPDPAAGVSTNANGEALLFADPGTHTVNFMYPLGYSGQASVNVNIEAAGMLVMATVNNVTDDIDGIWTITQTGNYYIRPDIQLVDIFLCGGGGGGGLVSSQGSSTLFSFTAAGGAGGFVAHLFGISNDGNVISVTIGAGGSSAPKPSSLGSIYTTGGKGGTTSIQIGGETYTAEGGNPGGASIVDIQGPSGGSGGGGALSGNDGEFSAGTGGSDGSDSSGESNDTYSGQGSGVTTRPFQDTTLPPCCAGGGGIAFRYGNSQSPRRGAGGVQGGGSGQNVDGTLADQLDATYYGSGGGGAYGENDGNQHSGTGYQGVVMIRRHVG